MVNKRKEHNNFAVVTYDLVGVAPCIGTMSLHVGAASSAWPAPHGQILVGKFELNPLRRPTVAWLQLHLTLNKIPLKTEKARLPASFQPGFR